MNAERLALHWGSQYSALHGGARITKRPLRFWLRDFGPPFLLSIAAMAGPAILWLLTVPG